MEKEGAGRGWRGREKQEKQFCLSPFSVTLVCDISIRRRERECCSSHAHSCPGRGKRGTAGLRESAGRGRVVFSVLHFFLQKHTHKRPPNALTDHAHAHTYTPVHSSVKKAPKPCVEERGRERGGLSECVCLESPGVGTPSRALSRSPEPARTQPPGPPPRPSGGRAWGGRPRT